MVFVNAARADQHNVHHGSTVFCAGTQVDRVASDWDIACHRAKLFYQWGRER